MPASWAELFDRGADYDVDLEAVRTAADELSTETETEAGDDA
ncbi:hypothetical protein Htur_3043 [Haloterrigena turkmenica DSM 5511]|uniref:Uncharacterized protein n=1 Tax=Haloterrigena turkmenica (strain ATCC 51198 / DSM 5511 / JCM 9101 / NCIMB 13204 / VKM B-1734 / 4k) TaxID=543526 RepID=D2RYU2_HALTV|nr:hypothetical protein [Haloterrigena turkmenica]ADB61910.1 hypothetical protein Htur_3043 [Haloterrigena turkmenica DSM 5511]